MMAYSKLRSIQADRQFVENDWTEVNRRNISWILSMFITFLNSIIYDNVQHFIRAGQNFKIPRESSC